MADPIKIIECPRDAWQGLPVRIPSHVKADYLNKLIAAGFKHIDAASFVFPGAVPQMADSEQVMEQIHTHSDVEIIGIVVNTKGAERAISTRAVRTLGFPFSVSPTFLQRNQRQTPDESLSVLKAIMGRASDTGLNMVVYISMAFGNPYGDVWNIHETVRACDRLVELGVQHVSLADTVGIATPSQVSQLLRAIYASHNSTEFGVHLHARPRQAAAMIRAAYEAGCRRFDSAIGGLGGCPFAQDTLVGNIPTEVLIAELRSEQAQVPKLVLDELIQVSREIARVRIDN